MKKRLLALMTAVMIAALTVMPVLASEPEPDNPPIGGGSTNDITPGDDTQYTEIAGETINFKKFLITEMGQELPQDLEFIYTVAAGDATDYAAGTPGTEASWEYDGQTYTSYDAAEYEAIQDIVYDQTAGTYEFAGQTYNTYDEAEAAAKAAVTENPATEGTPGTFAIYAGINPEDVKVGTAKFLVSDATADDKISVVAAGDNVELDEGEVYSRRTVTIDFSDVNFPEPGVYRYILTEQEITGAAGITYDTQPKELQSGARTRVLDVYVVDDGTGTLVIDNTTVMHEVVTEIKTTDENGSKDENATIATKWELVGVVAPYDQDPGYEPTGYDTYDEANADRIAIREKIHDDILDAQEALDDGNLQQDVQDAQDALDAAEQAQDIPTKQQAYDDAVAERESREADLADAQAALAATTDPAEITRLRGIIDTLTGDASTAGSIAEAQAAEDAAKAALDAAKAAVQTEQDALDAAEAALAAAEDRLAELQALYNTLGEDDAIVEVEWKLSDKSDNFVNEVAPLYNLQFHKKVTGNQGSRDKYFKFTVTISGLPTDGTVTIDDTNSKWTEEPTKTAATTYEASVMAAANTLTDEDQEKAGIQLSYTGTTFTHDFYLKHDEFIRILNLTKDVTYEVTEVEEDYAKAEGTDKLAKDADGLKVEIEALEKAIQEATTAGDTEKVTELQDELDALNAMKHEHATSGTLGYHTFTGFTNTKNGIIPTGVLISITGGAVMVILAAVYFLMRRRREEDYEY